MLASHHAWIGPLAAACLLAAPPGHAQPAAEWSPAQVREVLDKTQTVRIDADLSHLTAGEKAAVAKLLQVGEIFQDVYELQRHRSALQVKASLARRTDAHGRDLATLYRMFEGPIGVTLDNRAAPFVATDPAPPGGNVYPWDLTKAEYEAYIAAHPEAKKDFADHRSVIRRADAASLRADLAKLRQYPVLDTLHPGLRARLERLAARPDPTLLYAAPYSLAYADAMIKAHALLNEAADLVEPSDWDFAKFLRNRARDLLSDDYESGDAAWVRGRFKSLNAQIGAYEVYDDALLGTRAYYGLVVLVSRNAEAAALRQAMQGIQALENSLPSRTHRTVAEDIPVGVYDVVADFGQSPGVNTASNLPNEPYIVERYGNIVLMRVNIMRHPAMAEYQKAVFGAAIAPQFAADLTPDADFYRILWHEVGHYLGPDATTAGGSLVSALGSDAILLEEMKADLVSLFAAEELRRRGYYSDAQLRSVYAAGVLRVLQNNRPRREQPYNTMQLMQWNWFLDRGVLRFDMATAKMTIDYARYHAAVADLLRQVLALQEGGDRVASQAFIARWTGWDDSLHGKVAANIRSQQRYRYRLVTYQALEPR